MSCVLLGLARNRPSNTYKVIKLTTRYIVLSKDVKWRPDLMKDVFMMVDELHVDEFEKGVDRPTVDADPTLTVEPEELPVN